MPYYEFHWNEEVIEHLSENGISQDDFEHVVCNALSKGFSQ